MSLQCRNCVAGRRVGLDLRRPADRHRVARAAEMRGEQLHALVRRAAGPGPAAWYMLSVLGEPSTSRPPSSSSASMCCRTVVGMPFCASSSLIVPFWPSAESRCRPRCRRSACCRRSRGVDFVDEPADLDVDVFGKAGGDLHQAALERLLVFGDAVPGGQCRVARGEFRVLRDPALLLGALEDTLAVGVPAVIELALRICRPIPS